MYPTSLLVAVPTPLTNVIKAKSSANAKFRCIKLWVPLNSEFL